MTNFVLNIHIFMESIIVQCRKGYEYVTKQGKKTRYLSAML